MVPEGFNQEYSTSFIARSAELLENQLLRFKDADLAVTIRTGPYPDFAQPYLPHLHRATQIRAPHHVLADLHHSSPLSRLELLDIDHSYGKHGFTSPEENEAEPHFPHPNHIFSATISGRHSIPGHPPLMVYRPDLITRLDVDLHSCREAVQLIPPALVSFMDLKLIDGLEYNSPLDHHGHGHGHGHHHHGHHHHPQQNGPAG